jgi:LysM repeat protein
MIRRIIYILLIVLLVILAFLAVRWLLNRGGGEEGAETENGIAVVEEDMSATSPEAYPVDGVSGGETAVDSGSGESGAVAPSTEEGSVPPSTGEGETGTTGSADGDTSTGDAVGGVADSGDPDAGGGMPDASADASADATGGGGDVATGESASTGSDAPAAGTGGQTAVTTVTPGVATQHVVQQREWLTHLARCYGTTVRDIRAANHIPLPDLIYPGAVLTIPNPGNAGAITINDAPCFVHHTVQQGQNLSQIAQQYGINLHWLARINRVYNYNYIQAGQVLVIPNPVPAELTVAPPR